MEIGQDTLRELSNVAIAAAKTAGEFIANSRKADLEILHKEAGSSQASQIFTEIDRSSQEIILKQLLPSLSKYDIGFLAEESNDNKSRFAKDYFWCIDPLDGTLPFIEGKDGFAVSIALVSRMGRPLIGVVYDPAEGQLYHAIHSAGSYFNDNKIKLMHEIKFANQLNFNVDRSFFESTSFDDVMSFLQDLAIEMGLGGVTINSHGGAVMNACWLLDKEPGCYFKFPKKEKGGGSLWDYAASACIFQEAGGIVSNMYGKPLDLNRQESSFMNHEGVLFATNAELSLRIQDFYKDWLRSSDKTSL